MIVNVGSIAGLVGIPYSGIYAASKHALEALTEAMAFELGHLGIRVGIIEPGQYATELGANADTAAAMRPDCDAFRRWEEFRTASRRLVDGEPADPQQVADGLRDGHDIVRAAGDSLARSCWKSSMELRQNPFAERGGGGGGGGRGS